MAYREQIINDFEYQVRKAHGEGWDFVDVTTEDGFNILKLLNEQEAVEPIESGIKDVLLCGSCKSSLMREEGYRFRHCPWCGRRVKWD